MVRALLVCRAGSHPADSHVIPADAGISQPNHGKTYGRRFGGGTEWRLCNRPLKSP